MDLDPTSEDTGAAHEGGGAPTPLGRAPLPREHHGGSPTYPLHPYIPTYPKNSKTEDRSGLPPPQASVATKKPLGSPFRHPAGGGTHHWWP